MGGPPAYGSEGRDENDLIFSMFTIKNGIDQWAFRLSKC
jgi:hypothetical protein